MFTLTSAAARQIQQAASGSGSLNLALRIAARIDAQGEVAYGMGFDDPKEEDMKLELEGVSVVIAEEFQQVLNDIVLDFVELEPGEFNFIFADVRQMPVESGAGGGCSTGGCGAGSCGGGGGGCGTQGRTH